MTNKEELQNAVAAYETVTLLNKVSQFERHDSKSERFQGFSMSGLLSKFGIKKESELAFDDYLINKYVPDLFTNGKNKTIEDIFYRKMPHQEKERRSPTEISGYIQTIEASAIKYNSGNIVAYKYDDFHDTQLTLPEKAEITRADMLKRELLKADKISIDYEKLNTIYKLMPEPEKNVKKKRKID